MNTPSCLEVWTRGNKVKMKAPMLKKALSVIPQPMKAIPLKDYIATYFNVPRKWWSGVLNQGYENQTNQ